MVRINLVDPRQLADQHLIAEYNEILMLFGHVKKHPAIRNAPPRYCLGKGHISFFKDKLLYLKHRHDLIKVEMRRRGFRAAKTISLSRFPKILRNDFSPDKNDFRLIRRRLLQKIRLKPEFYTYCREHRSLSFFRRLLSDSFINDRQTVIVKFGE